MGPAMNDVLIHRVKVLERDAEDIEKRVRVLELAHAKMIGYCAGAAFAGGLISGLLQWFIGG